MERDGSALTGDWQNLYDSFRFQANMARNENTQRLHQSFNRKLAQVLLDFQEASKLPSKDQITEIATNIIEHLRQEIFYGNGRINYTKYEVARLVDRAIESAIWTPVHLPNGRLQIIAAIDELAVPKEGIQWLQEALSAQRDEYWYHLHVCLADVPNEPDSNSSFAAQLAEIGIRKARDEMKKWLKTNQNAFSGFHYPIMKRIEDWITLNIG